MEEISHNVTERNRGSMRQDKKEAVLWKRSLGLVEHQRSDDDRKMEIEANEGNSRQIVDKGGNIRFIRKLDSGGFVW